MVAAVSSNLSAVAVATSASVAAPASAAAPPLNTESSEVSTNTNTNTGNNISTVARKRRRQILQTLRETKASATSASTTTIGEPNPKKMCTSESQDTDTSQAQDQGSGSGPRSSSVSDPPAITQDAPAYIVTSSKTNTLRARKVSHCDGIAPPANADAIQAALSSDDPKTKRPQMRYEPDVPMTKEEATAWRREQRRKRNRESAAASRQRQRDRIAELEVEVDEWKVKYQAALERLKGLESLHHLNSGSRTSSATVAGGLTVSLPLSQDDSIRISPCPSPKAIHHSVTAVPSEVLSSTIAIPRCAVTGTSSNANVKIATSAMTLNARTEEKEEHLKENHSLPAL
jgi:hypothetical protein